jgi:hypothetical protein
MRASVLVAAAGVCLLAACSGSSGTGTSSSGSGSGVTFTNKGCSLTFSGSYTFTYTQLSGNCPMLQPVHEMINGMAGAQSAQNLSAACPNGSGTDVATPSSSGGCDVTGNFSGCQVPNTGATLDFSEQVDWNASYTSATGTVSFNIMGSASCTGTYSLSVTQP